MNKSGDYEYFLRIARLPLVILKNFKKRESL